MKKAVVRIMLGLCLLVFVMASSGCVTQRHISISHVPDQAIAQIVKGQTTKVTILEQMNEPDQRIPLDNKREEFCYIDEDFETRATRFNRAEIDRKRTELWIIFDENDKVADFGRRPTLKEKHYTLSSTR